MKTKHPTRQHHENVKHHAKALVEATSHIADSKVAEARKKLSEIVDLAKEEFEEAEEKVVEAAKKADKFVRENPYQAAGIGVGLGVLLALFWTRRKGDSKKD